MGERHRAAPVDKAGKQRGLIKEQGAYGFETRLRSSADKTHRCCDRLFHPTPTRCGKWR